MADAHVAHAVQRGAPGLVRIDRKGIFGNPFVLGRDGTREEVIDKFRHYVTKVRPFSAKELALLRGKDLACWCAPQPCHGDVLLALANGETTGRVLPFAKTKGLHTFHEYYKGGNPWPPMPPTG